MYLSFSAHLRARPSDIVSKRVLGLLLPKPASAAHSSLGQHVDRFNIGIRPLFALGLAVLVRPDTISEGHTNASGMTCIFPASPARRRGTMSGRVIGLLEPIQACPPVDLPCALRPWTRRTREDGPLLEGIYQVERYGACLAF